MFTGLFLSQFTIESVLNWLIIVAFWVKVKWYVKHKFVSRIKGVHS